MLRISNDIEFLAHIENQIYMLGGIIRQKDPEMFAEIINTLDSGNHQKRELELKRAITQIMN